MQSKHLHFEQLTAAHADELFPILTAPSVLAFIDSNGSPPTLEDVRAEYAARANGPAVASMPEERWFNVAIRLSTTPFSAIGRLEATEYDGWGEVAYLLGAPWWGKGLAFEAMVWWQTHLAANAPGTQWWAAVHPMNHRSIRLLERLGYRPSDSSDRPRLQSYDLGDCCFFKPIR